MKNKLTNVFMLQSEIDNCTFEPKIGSMNPIKQAEETKPGEFFDKLGLDFDKCLVNDCPKIYKLSILKKSKRYLKDNKWVSSFNALYDGFDMDKVMGHCFESEHKIWKNKVNLDTGKNTGKIEKLNDIIKEKYKDLEKRKPWLIKLFVEIA